MLLAMGAYEGGAHALLLPQIPCTGGLPVCLSAYTLFSYIDPKRYLNCLQMVPQQSGVSGVCVPLNNFSHIPLGGGVLGAIYEVRSQTNCKTRLFRPRVEGEVA
jgi:hypothetical protein